MMAIMSVAWLEPWVVWATRNAEPARVTPLVTPWLMVALILISASITRFLARTSDTWRQMAGRQVLCAFLALIITEMLVLNRASLQDYLIGLITWNSFFSPEAIVLVVAAILWLRGILIGRADVMREDLESMFYTGIVALVILLLFDASHPVVPFADLLWSALIFFVTSLLALALVGPEHAHFWHRETSAVRLMLNRYWLVTIVVTISLFVLIGLAFAGTAGPEALSMVRDFAITVIKVLALVFQAIMTVVVVIIVLLLSPLIPLFERLGPLLGEIMNRVRPPTFGTDDATAQAVQSAFNADAAAALMHGLAVLTVVMMFALLFLLVLIRLGFISTRRNPDETRENIATRALLLNQLKDLLARWRAHSDAEALPYLALSGDDPRTIVRRAYQQFLEWAKVRVSERAPHQTPLAYADFLANRLPEQREAIIMLTNLYIQARYAVEALSPAEAHTARESLANLQSTPVIQS